MEFSPSNRANPRDFVFASCFVKRHILSPLSFYHFKLILYVEHNQLNILKKCWSFHYQVLFSCIILCETLGLILCSLFIRRIPWFHLLLSLPGFLLYYRWLGKHVVYFVSVFHHSRFSSISISERFYLSILLRTEVILSTNALVTVQVP